MWTAAGERISTQQIFQKAAPEKVRAMYRKHAIGNSLFRNNGDGSFHDASFPAGVGMGRWSWSCDAWDFDHDGFSDLYITNGMVSGAAREDLNSFFWRQVVANSPDDARSSPAYEQGWNAINELIRADGTWSGYERNVFYANNGDGTFSDVSGVVGLDFMEDGRSFALADLDHDGRLEIVLKNRNAPQVRLLKNAMHELPPSISFRLQGTKSNRDAIGATITVEAGSSRQTRSLQAGSGFLSQHTKDVFFGLGKVNGPVKATIHWPEGLTQELRELPINHRVWVEEGRPPSRMDPFKTIPATQAVQRSVSKEPELLPEQAETWLLEPFPAPNFSFSDLSGQARSLSAFRGKPVLLNFCSAKSVASRQELKLIQNTAAAWKTKGLQVIAISAD